MKIVVISNGFVFVCRGFSQGADAATMTDARCIASWGTQMGLAQLVSGPTKDTVLDAKIPIVEVPIGQIVFTFDVADAWGEHL